MAVKIQGKYTLQARPQDVWDKMLCADVLRECIPGCQSLEAEDETNFRGIVTIKVGPIRATFKGRVELSEVSKPVSLRLSGAGQGGIAGSVRGFAFIELSSGDLADTTSLAYHGDVAIGGKLAQLGSRLIEGVSRKLADQFFDDLAAKINDTTEQSA